MQTVNENAQKSANQRKPYDWINCQEMYKKKNPDL